ncbi:MAG TPA: hypothetical protein VHQ90_15195 [Thermoanaerobaculia bacterium]|nr:hypothetical protein [Thermoanaerobaculia bacterium]
MACELMGERLHRLDPARREHQVVAVSRRFTGKVRADAARGTGDQGQGTTGTGHRFSFTGSPAHCARPGLVVSVSGTGDEQL